MSKSSSLHRAYGVTVSVDLQSLQAVPRPVTIYLQPNRNNPMPHQVRLRSERNTGAILRQCVADSRPRPEHRPSPRPSGECEPVIHQIHVARQPTGWIERRWLENALGHAKLNCVTRHRRIRLQIDTVDAIAVELRHKEVEFIERGRAQVQNRGRNTEAGLIIAEILEGYIGLADGLEFRKRSRWPMKRGS